VLIDGQTMRLDGRRVRRIVEIDRVTAVPGLPAPAEGLALADDRLTVVVRIGSARGSAFAILYEVNESQIALVGAEPTGFSDDDAVPTYDVETMFARFEASVWAARAGRRARGTTQVSP
jgi:hypothetical protein